MGSLVETQRKKMGRGRLRLSFLLSLVAVAASIPAPQEDVRESAQEDINTEDMPNIFRDLFIPSREARELSDEDGDEDVQDVSSADDDEEDDDVAAAMEIDHRMGKNENKKGKGKKVSTSRKKKNGKKGKGKGK